MMWIVIFGTLALLSVIGVIYLVSRFHRFSALQRLGETHKLLSWLLALVPVAGVLCFYFINLFTMFVVVVHLLLIWLLCDLIALIIRKCTKRERTRNIEGAAAICITAAVLCVGWYNAHHVIETDYTVTTDKSLGGEPLRIALIADSHLGITLDGDKFSREMEKIEATNPDVLFIAGDFVDDDSEKQDMLDACAALGRMQTKYGVYFIFGNHDEGYFDHRNFTAADLRNALTENGVIILEDASVTIDNRFTVIGRQDKTVQTRADMQTLTADLDDSLFQVLLDHQPNDYASEAAAGGDLVLSGHTHGGHIFPAGQIGLLMGANDRVYGTETRGNTEFLVTSGISGWAIPFKTGTVSEYVIIDVVERPDGLKE